jgi:5-methylcytosine-specific restriction endonuclease McrA
MKSKYSTIQASADKAMSLYIRQKYAKDDMVTCVSCGKVVHWKEADCDHFVPKSRGASIRYIEENCHPECPGCNRFNDGHLIGYTRYMLEMYGEEKIDELQAEARKVLSQTEKRRMAEEAKDYYTNKLKELK